MADRKKLRASHADRRRAIDILATALREGRLDALEHDARTRSVETVKSIGELDRLLADLPARLGVRHWAQHLRIRVADRELVTRWLADALQEERLSGEEHEQRLAALASAGTYADLTPLLDGVPGPPDAAREELFVSAADRRTALDRLSQAVADGLLTPDEQEDLQTGVRRARRYVQLDELAVDLDKRVSAAERARAIRCLDHAHAHGRLDAAEHAKRVSAAGAATRDRELKRLLADLTGAPGNRAASQSLLSLNKRHRLSDADREQAAQELQQALDEGRLTLDEYDERVRAAYAAGTAGTLKPLLSDLIEPSQSPPAAPAGRGRSTAGRRGWLAAAAGAAAVVVAVVVGPLIRGAGDEGGAAVPDELSVLWSAPFDRPSDVTNVGNWIVGDTVIRARTDKVIASALADGSERWTFPIPAGNEICTMSRGVEANVGLVGYKTDAEYSCVTVVALDVSTGRALWQRQRGPMPGVPFHTYGDEVAVADQIALSREGSAFVAVNLRDGKPQWRKTVGKGCEDYSVTAEGDTAVLLSTCKNHTAQLVVVDIASGRERWQAQLHTDADDEKAIGWGQKSTVVLSVDPVVVRASDEGGTGGAFISFDAQGRRLAAISQSQRDMDLAVDGFPGALAARPVYPVSVAGDVLVTPARKVGEDEDRYIAGFSRTDGRRLWITESDDELSAVLVTPDKILATQGVWGNTKVVELSIQDGRILRKGDLDGETDKIDEAVGYPADVRIAGGRYVFITMRGGTVPPIVVVG